MFTNKSNYDELLEETINLYGIENEGRIWCNNCGEELFIAEYESLEGFKKNGARDITHEVLVDEEAEEQKQLSEEAQQIDMVKKLLLKSQPDDNITLINELIMILTDIMGIKLSNKDKLEIIDETNNLSKMYVKDKESYRYSYKGKPKHFDRKYEDYKNNSIIIYSSAILFIYLQTSIPEYIFTKQHSKCKANLDGYPLDQNPEKLNGIKYFVCILSELNNTESIWKCLKKKNIEKDLVKIITKKYENIYIQNRYKKKAEYIKKKLEKQEINVNNEWSKFCPPLVHFAIEDDGVEKLDCKQHTSEILEYFSLKIISEINKIVNKSDIENNLFLPALVNQSCCLSDINNEFNNINFFKEKNAAIIKYLEKIALCEENKNKHNSTIISLLKQEKDKLIESFSKIMLPLEKDLDQQSITEMFVNYINDGVNTGKKQIYDGGISIYTGETKETIQSRIYRNEDYYMLLDNIAKRNLTENKPLNIEYDEFTNFKQVIVQNKHLIDDIYITSLLEHLETNNTKVKITQIWDDFCVYIELLKEELNTIISESLRSKKDTKELLNNIADLKSIKEENIQRYGEEKALELYYLDKKELLSKYIDCYLKETIIKIKNKKDVEFIKIPYEWKLDENYMKLLLTNLNNDNKIVKKYLERTESVGLYNDIYNEVKYSTINLNKIYTKKHRYDCNNKLLSYSKLTDKNLCCFLEYILIKLMINIINSRPREVKVSKTSFIGDDDGELDAGAEAPTEIGDDITGFMAPGDLSTDYHKEKVNLIYDIITEISKDSKKNDLFTQKKINESIDKKSDIEKEANLKFIEDLDKEARQSLKQMLAAGIYSYKNLHQLRKPDEEEPDKVELSEEEKESMFRDKALTELGGDFTEEQYQSWKEEAIRNKMEEEMNLNEVELPLDDDGDEMVDEDFDGEL